MNNDTVIVDNEAEDILVDMVDNVVVVDSEAEDMPVDVVVDDVTELV